MFLTNEQIWIIIFNTNYIGGKIMVYVCALCGYEYNPKVGDPDNGIAAGTDFEDVSADWVCPLCGATKEDFEAVEEDE